MKSFKEFLMEEDNQIQDFEILNSLKEFLENFDTKKDDINQEIIVKYLICKSLINLKKNFKSDLRFKISNIKILEILKNQWLKISDIKK